MTWPRALDRYERDPARSVAPDVGTRVVGTTLADAYEACRL